MDATTPAPRVLIVQAEPGPAAAAADEVQALGGTAVIAASAAQALAHLAQWRPSFMLLATPLPDLTTLALLDQVEAAGVALPPFLVVTPAGEEHRAAPLMARGARGMLALGPAYTALLPQALAGALRELDATARLQAAKRAAERESGRYRKLIDHSLDGVVIFAPDGTIRDLNPAYARMMGYERDELLGDKLQRLKEPEQADDVPQRLQYIIDHSPCRLESVNRARDGQAVYVEASALHEPSLGVMAVVRDITQRRAAERKLRLAARVLESAAEAVMVTDAEHRILEVNRAFSLITGHAADEVLGRTPAMLLVRPSGEADALRRQIDEVGQWQGELRLRRRSGEVFCAWFSISRVEGDNQQPPVFVTLFSDISSVKAMAEHLDHLAHHDPLTLLPNRLLLQARLKHSLELAQRHGHGLGLLYLDLDHFKDVNDRLGHAAGDALLCELAHAMSGILREVDTLARLGGDEFVVLLEGACTVDDLQRLVRELLGLFPRPVATPQGPVQVTVSIGGALFPLCADTAESLIGSADRAMYAAKNAGRQTFVMAPRLAAAGATRCVEDEGRAG